MTAHRQTHRLKPVRLVKRGTTPTPLAKWRQREKKGKKEVPRKNEKNREKPVDWRGEISTEWKEDFVTST
jgi:hypothetical protein